MSDPKISLSIEAAIGWNQDYLRLRQLQRCRLELLDVRMTIGSKCVSSAIVRDEPKDGGVIRLKMPLQKKKLRGTKCRCPLHAIDGRQRTRGPGCDVPMASENATHDCGSATDVSSLEFGRMERIEKMRE